MQLRHLLIGGAALTSACYKVAANTALHDPGMQQYLLPPIQVEPDVREVVARLDYVRFKEHIFELSRRSADPVPDRFQGVEWVEAQLRKSGYEIARDTFSITISTYTNIFVTKRGTRFPDEVIIVSANLEGTGRQRADDNASGCALVLELARILAAPDIEVDRSVRFMFFGGLRGQTRTGIGVIGSQMYAQAFYRKQGVENPRGSGLYPQPAWQALIHHRMILYDHGVLAGNNQSPTADIDIEYDRVSRQSGASAQLAHVWERANALYAAGYPAEIGDRMIRSDAYAFRDYIASINVSENQRVRELDIGANPFAGRDRYEQYSEDDFMFGFNVLQTTTGGVGHVAGFRIVRQQ